MLNNMKTDILIIGAGPAGLTAGIYGARAGKTTVILEGRSDSRPRGGFREARPLRTRRSGLQGVRL